MSRVWRVGSLTRHVVSVLRYTGTGWGRLVSAPSELTAAAVSGLDVGPDDVGLLAPFTALASSVADAVQENGIRKRRVVCLTHCSRSIRQCS